MTMEEKLELLLELLTLVDLSMETSKQVDPGVLEDKDMLDFVACSR